MTQPWLDPILRLGAAFVAGGVIGFERQFRARPAGLRTHILVSIGSAIVVLIPLGAGWADSSHVIQGVATGIGFLCAGDILHHVRAGDERVTGLTSAAALWVTAALGMAAAVGNWPLTVVGTGATLLTLTAIHYLEKLVPKSADPGASGDGPP